MLILGYRESQRVVFPVFREIGKGNSFLRFHLFPQSCTGQGRQEKYIKIVQTILTGHLSDTFADPRFVYVQSDDKGTHNHNFVALYTTHRSSKVPILYKVEFFAKLQESLLHRGLKADKNTTASGFHS